MKKIDKIIVDGNNMAFRSAYAIDLTNEAGEDISVTYGTLRSVRSTLVKFDPKNLIVCWDRGRSKARISLLRNYKSIREYKGRANTRQHIYDQITVVQALLSLLGIPQVTHEGFECDDVICDLILSDNKKVKRLIVSSDKDFFQLISKNVSIYDAMKDELWDIGNFNQKVGLSPDRYLDYHIMIGDSSDGIPGISGIGKKTAQDILMAYGTLDKAMRVLESNPHSIWRYNKLIEHRTKVSLNRELIDLKRFHTEHKKQLKRSKNLLNPDPNTDFKTFEDRVLRPEYGFRSLVDNAWLMPFRKLAIRKGMKK